MLSRCGFSSWLVSDMKTITPNGHRSGPKNEFIWNYSRETGITCRDRNQEIFVCRIATDWTQLRKTFFFLPANRMMTSNKQGLLCSLSKGNNQEMKALISNSDSCLRTYVEFLNLMVFTVMWCKKKLKISQTMASVRNSPISFVINSHLNSQLPFIYLVLTVPINIYKVSCYIL